MYMPEMWQELHEKRPDLYPPLTDDEVKMIKGRAIRAKYGKLLNDAVSKYNLSERETWSLQLKEAEEFIKDPNGTFPLLLAIAESRGVSIEIMVQKIKENDTLYRNTIGTILGQQQAELDSI